MAKNTIKLKDYLHVVEEYDAAAAITPGMLVEVTSGGKVQAHSVDGGDGLPVMFANEDEFQGKTINDDYAIGDKVQCWIPQRGDMVYALLANGENVAVGAALSSNADGSLKAVDSSGGAIAVAAEALNNTSSFAARIIVRIV